MGGQGGDAVYVVVRTRQDGRPAGRADGICAKAVVEPHALRCDTIDVGGLVYPAAIGADGMGRVIVGHDEQDVRT